MGKIHPEKTILWRFQLAMDAQNSSSAYYMKGEEYLSELKESAEDRSEPVASRRALKILENVKKIDRICKDQIDLLDKLRRKLVTDLGEQLKPVGGPAGVLFEEFPDDPVKPDFYRLSSVKYTGNTDFLSEHAREIVASMKTFRTELLTTLAASSSTDDQKYFYKPPMIGNEPDTKKLLEILDVQMQAFNVAPDDKESLKHIYIDLTYTDSHWQELLHADCRWENVFGLLTGLQSKVLEARSNALGTIRMCIGCCAPYVFDQFAVCTPGPEYVKAGEEVSFDVFMAAYDWDSRPEVKLLGGKANVVVRDGKATVTLKAPKAAEMEIAGTITIFNKSGIPKTLPWRKKIVIGK